MTALTVEQACTVELDQEIAVVGTLTSITRRITKQGRPWASAFLSGPNAAIEILVYPNPYERLCRRLAIDADALVTGRIDDRENRPVLIVQDMQATDTEVTR